MEIDYNWKMYDISVITLDRFMTARSCQIATYWVRINRKNYDRELFKSW